MGIVSIQGNYRNSTVYRLINQLRHLVTFIGFHQNTVHTGCHGDPHKVGSGIFLRQVLPQQVHIYIFRLPPLIGSAVYRLPEVRLPILRDHHIILVIFFLFCYFMKLPHIGTKNNCAYRNDCNNKHQKPYNDPLASVSAHFFSLMTHMYLSQTGIPDRIPPNLLLKIPYKNAIFHIRAKMSKNIQIVH